MARRRDSASERLKEWIEHAKKPRVPEQSLIELGRRLVPKGQQKTIDWNDRAQRAYCAHEALLLNLGELDEPLRKAFDAFGYDPINPFDWRMLLSHFAYAHFAPPRKRGAPKKWNDDRWCELLSNFCEVKTTSRPTTSDSEVCKNIKKRFKTQYSKESPGTLRRNLQYARDPSRNHTLALVRDKFVIELRNWATAQLGASSSLNAEALKSMALDLAREYLESAWKRRAADK
jgi:hypothetical protein